MGKSIARDKAKAFAIRIIRLYKYLVKEKKEFVISKQILRSGTSIGANLAEQEYAISDADFLNKTSLALKESSETSYWLYLLHQTEYISQTEFENLNCDCQEIIRMLIKSVKSTKAKLGR